MCSDQESFSCHFWKLLLGDDFQSLSLETVQFGGVVHNRTEREQLIVILEIGLSPVNGADHSIAETGAGIYFYVNSHKIEMPNFSLRIPSSQTI